MIPRNQKEANLPEGEFKENFADVIWSTIFIATIGLLLGMAIGISLGVHL